MIYFLELKFNFRFKLRQNIHKSLIYGLFRLKTLHMGRVLLPPKQY